MKTIKQQLLPWLGRYWLRIGIVLVFLFILNQKQIDLSIQLGSPGYQTQPTAPPPAQPANRPLEEKGEVFTSREQQEAAGKSWLQRMNVFGSTSYGDLVLQLQAVPEERVRGFLRRFAHVARKEQEKYGIPASIILANALLQSAGGTSVAAQGGDNLFNLGCTADWQGTTFEEGGHCYRKYDNAWTSFRDHSLYLTSGKFAGLNRLASTDYQAWATGLEKLDFNQQSNLAEQLLFVIDHWQLFQFDR